MNGSQAARRQLRFALSMNGGVSLAVWIGGGVAEIDRLRAPRADDTFWSDLMADCGYEPTAQVDVMSGASAGGLNAVAMAQAIMAGRSYDDFLPVWLEIADIDKLVKPPLEAVRPGTAREILKGGFFYQSVADALHAMPPNGELDHDLGVFASATLVRANGVHFRDAPGDAINEARSDAYFHIARRGSAERGLDGFVDGPGVVPSIDALAMAGRATSSLPGLFEPMEFRRATFGSRLVGAFVDGRETVQVMDGGVIDNVPIARAIRAIANSRADRPVRRVLLYLHPDPSGDGSAATAAPEEARSALAVMGSFVGKRAETIREDIELLRAHNDAARRRVDEARALVDSFRRKETGTWAEAQDLVDTMTVATLLRAAADPATEMTWHAPHAPRALPLLDGNRPLSKGHLGRSLMAVVSQQPDLLLAARTARITLALMRLMDMVEDDDRTVDLGTARTALYSLHLLCDLIQGYQLAHFLDADDEESAAQALLDSHGRLTAVRAATPLPDAAWKALAWWDLDLLPSPQDGPVLTEHLAELVAAAIAALPELAGSHVAPSVVDLVAGLRDGSVTCDELDRLFLPLAAEFVGSDQPIAFVRVAGNVRTPASEAFADDEHKIAGRQLRHLGAFFSPAWRENDWWWGRLDSVPALVDALLDTEALDSLVAHRRFPDLPADRAELRATVRTALIAERQCQLINERFHTNAADIDEATHLQAFDSWRRDDRRLSSLVGTRALTSTSVRGLISASKVLRHEQPWPAKVAITVMRQVMLAIIGFLLAGTRAAAAIAWTLCVLAAVRTDSPRQAWIVWSLGVGAAGAITWVVELKIRPTRRHTWHYAPYPLAGLAVVGGAWAIVERDWLHRHDVPALGWSLWWPIPAVAATIAASMIFYWLRRPVGLTLIGLTGAMYAGFAYAAARADSHTPLAHWPAWWPLHSMWVCWIFAITVFPALLGLLPEAWLRPHD